MAVQWTFNALGTSKEEVKRQIRSPANRDCPQISKQLACQSIDAEPMTPGHTMRVSMVDDEAGGSTTTITSTAA